MGCVLCDAAVCGVVQLPDVSPGWLQQEAIKEGRREYVTAGLTGVGLTGVGFGTLSSEGVLEKGDVRARLGRELVSYPWLPLHTHYPCSPPHRMHAHSPLRHTVTQSCTSSS